MELKTRILLDWHLGIPDGEERYRAMYDYTDDVEKQKELAMNTVKNSHLLQQYDLEDLFADASYGKIDIRINSTDIFKESVAQVTVEHFLKAGNTYFKLEKADI